MARPSIAISSCLLGNRVRYDGEIKQFPLLVEFVEQHFEVIPVCPEVEIGLTVPRPPVQLVVRDHQVLMLGRDQPSLDLTQTMLEFCNRRPVSLQSISGYIFKSRSPSCGLRDTPFFNPDSEIISYGSGLFANCIETLYPQLPVVDEVELDNEAQRQQYLQQVLNYYHEQQS